MSTLESSINFAHCIHETKWIILFREVDRQFINSFNPRPLLWGEKKSQIYNHPFLHSYIFFLP